MDTNTIKQSNNTWQQLLITVVAVIVAFALYHFFFASNVDAYDKFHKERNKALELQIKTLQNQVDVRNKVIEARKDSISDLKLQLSQSNQRTIDLTKQLQDAKTKITSATDSDNVDFFSNYVRTRK